MVEKLETQLSEQDWSTLGHLGSHISFLREDINRAVDHPEDFIEHSSESLRSYIKSQYNELLKSVNLQARLWGQCVGRPLVISGEAFDITERDNPVVTLTQEPVKLIAVDTTNPEFGEGFLPDVMATFQNTTRVYSSKLSQLKYTPTETT